MTWRRGFFRLWIVLSVLWLAVIAATFNPASIASDLSARLWWEADPIISGPWENYQTDEQRVAVAQERAIVDARQRRGWQQLQALFGFGLIPPLALLMLGIGIFWAINGFHEKEDQ